MLIKAGVDISRLEPGARHVLGQAQIVLVEEIVVTSTYEGNHDPSSLHYVNRAVDLRKPKGDAGYAKSIADKLQAALGKAYFVLVEGECIHIQFNG